MRLNVIVEGLYSLSRITGIGNGGYLFRARSSTGSSEPVHADRAGGFARSNRSNSLVYLSNGNSEEFPLPIPEDLCRISNGETPRWTLCARPLVTRTNSAGAVLKPQRPSNFCRLTWPRASQTASIFSDRSIGYDPRVCEKLVVEAASR